MKRQHSDTSKEAELAKTIESKGKDYSRIIKALKVLGSANYDRISQQMDAKEPNIVSRRMKEMVELGLIRKTETKSLTSRNRNAYNYCLINQPKTENELKVEKSPAGKSVSDYSKDLTNQSTLFQ